MPARRLAVVGKRDVHGDVAEFQCFATRNGNRLFGRQSELDRGLDRDRRADHRAPVCRATGTMSAI